MYPTKVRIFWEGHKIFQNLHLTFVYSTYIQTKVRSIFRKILWSFQNMWTLTTLASQFWWLSALFKQENKKQTNFHNFFWEAQNDSWTVLNLRQLYMFNLKEKEMKKMSDMQTMKLWQLTPGGQYGPPHYKSLSSTSLIKGVW